MSIAVIIYIVLGAVVLFIVWFFIDMARETKRTLFNALKQMKPDDIPSMADECVQTFKSKLGKELSLSDLASSLRILDEALEDKNRQATRIAFNKEGAVFPFRYMVYLGAFVGEIIRTRTNAIWIPSPLNPEAGPALDISGTIVHPFNKIVKMILGDDPGDLTIYVAAILDRKKS